MNYQFSVILPVRNGGTYVKECVNSVLAQTYPNFNLIVLDNNSTDGTKEWIASLKSEKIIIYPSNNDLTIEDNWARAVEVPKNEFMTLIGHDDILLLDYLETMNCLINENPNASLYQTHFKYIDASGGVVRDCQPMVKIQSVTDFINCQFLRTLDSTGTGYLFRSKDFEVLGGMPISYPNLIFADYELWIKLCMISCKVTSPDFCFSYRLHNSVSRHTNGEDYQQAFKKYLKLLISLRENSDIKKAIDENGIIFLTYFCQSLSHRILKTPVTIRKITVNQFVKECIELSRDFIPQHLFKPYYKIQILAAILLDNKFGRVLYRLFKKIKLL
ncbi:MAG: glycosyltransferase [Chitinophagaceae bacterium]|nr:glycosyltransferase [Chitinophagaceae bacterium]